MEQAFILNPALSAADLKDTIEEKICKIKGILSCVIFALEFTHREDKLDHTSVCQVLWTINEFLEEVDYLRQKLGETVLIS